MARADILSPRHFLAGRASPASIRSPNDGTIIGALQNSAILDALLDTLRGDTRRLHHDATKLVYLGSATIDAGLNLEHRS